jgi:hypothetical protein
MTEEQRRRQLSPKLVAAFPQASGSFPAGDREFSHNLPGAMQVAQHNI